ncbi:BspA family leucine-rich repeat surface protein [Listeria monocytogenes]|uniref:BspA family leucine-rich repeat surface protein n=1 Tax=Listeria monocytogenes TaxID=1639 RepID=UPI0017D6AFF6|nr:BspA family leucine-rich repeat surface protein [Listeria monocytogenes]
MKLKKIYIFFLIILTGIMLISHMRTLLANYNIVEDIRLITSAHSLKEEDTVTISVMDSNIEDTKLVIPIDENMEYIDSDYQDASVVFDQINHQVVIDWLNPSNEKKSVNIRLKLNKEGIYPLKALTVRENQEVSTEEKNIEVNALKKSKEESAEPEFSKSFEESSSKESAETKVDNTYAIKTGLWGTAHYEFNEEVGEIKLQSGELTNDTESDWQKRGINSKLIKKIIFQGSVNAPSNSEGLFSSYGSYAFKNLEEIDGLEHLNTSKVTNMKDMFYYSKALVLDVSHFDTSKVTDMSYMFSNASISDIDLSNFDTSNVTDMSAMFNYSKVSELDISHLNTSNVVNMDSMFADSKASVLDVSHFDTSKVTNMNFMFYNTRTELDVSHFDTSKVTNMSAMFRNNPSTKLDVSHFDTSKVTSMDYMFSSTSISDLDLSTFDTSKVLYMDNMLYGVKLSKLKLGEKFRVTSDSDTSLGSPKALNLDDEVTGNWIREYRSSTPYSPKEFLRNYGKGDLTPGIYVAETVLPGEITAEANISNQTHSDGLLYVNDEVKIENTIHHTGDVYNFIYKTTIPEELTISEESFKGYIITEDGHKIDFPVDAFKFDKSRRTLEVNLKSIVEQDAKGNYYTAVDVDFYYEINGKANKDAIGKNLEINTTINYFNSILNPKPDVNLSTKSKKIYGLEPQWDLLKEIKNVSRPDDFTAVEDSLLFTITATNREELGAMESFDMAESLFPKDLDFISGSAELIFPDGTIKKLPDSVYQPDKQIVSTNVFSGDGYVGVKPYQLRFKAKVKDTAYGKTLETKASLYGITQTKKEVIVEDDIVKINVDYTGKLGFKETPKTLSFNDNFISVFTSTIGRKDENWGISIEDTRMQKQPWNLSVKQVTSFVSTAGDTLTQVLIFRKNGQEDIGIDTTISADVYSEDKLDKNDYFISWSKNEGLLLKVPPGKAKAKQYQTELQWNLKDTPI